MDIVKIDKIVCIETIEEINFKSPPNSLANAYADDAVGILANKISNNIISPCISNNKQMRYIITGEKIIFPIVAIVTALFVVPIDDMCNPTPTDNSPKGKAADVKIDKVFSIRTGNEKPKRLNAPPNKQAKISGFFRIDLKKEITVILFLGTYIEKIEIHKRLINGIINVIRIKPIIKLSSLNKASVSAKNT